MSDRDYIGEIGLLSTSGPLVQSTHHYDYLIRATSTKTVVKNTVDVQAQIGQWAGTMAADLAQLKNVVQWQHDLIEYNSTYQAYLLEQLSDEEFAEEAEKYAYEPQEIDVEQLAAGIERLYGLTNIAFTPSDICGLFRCDHDLAVRAVERARETYPELSHLVPKEG